MKKIFISGSNGFIGKKLVKRLSQKHFIYAGVRSLPNHSSQAPNISYIQIPSLEKMEDDFKLAKDIDIVIHLASRNHRANESQLKNKDKYISTNVRGSENLFKLAIKAKIPHFIHLSSLHAITTTSKELITETSECNPDSIYGRSKLDAEKTLRKIAQNNSTKLYILRPPLVYGPNSVANFQKLINFVKKEYPLPIKSIHNKRSFVFIDNLINAIETIIENLNNDTPLIKTYHICDDKNLSTKELVELIANHLNKKAKLFSCPEILIKYLALLAGKKEDFNKIKSSLFTNSEHFCRDYNWKAPYTIEQGIKKSL